MSKKSFGGSFGKKKPCSFDVYANKMGSLIKKAKESFMVQVILFISP